MKQNTAKFELKTLNYALKQLEIVKKAQKKGLRQQFFIVSNLNVFNDINDKL